MRASRGAAGGPMSGALRLRRRAGWLWGGFKCWDKKPVYDTPCICLTRKTKKNMPILVAFTIDVRICRYWYLAQEKTKVQIIDQLLSQLNMIWFGLILTVKTAFFLCNIKFRSLKKIVKFRAYLFSSLKMQQLGKYEFKPCVGSYVAIRKFRINRSYWAT